MIPTKPPPVLKHPEDYNNEFSDFISRCLVKSPEDRPSATVLLQHKFTQSSKPVAIVKALVQRAMAKLEEEELGDNEVCDVCWKILSNEFSHFFVASLLEFAACLSPHKCNFTKDLTIVLLPSIFYAILVSTVLMESCACA